jgi:hypothetical protein
MSQDGTDWAEYDRDLKEFERTARDALIASGFRPLTPDEQALLAWAAGLPMTHNPERKRT